jgi:hypothetical protein
MAEQQQEAESYMYCERVCVCVCVQVEEELQKEVQREVKRVEYALENDLSSFGKGFTVLEQVWLHIVKTFPRAFPQ